MLARVNLYLKGVEGMDPLETPLLAREKDVGIKGFMLVLLDGVEAGYEPFQKAISQQ